MRHTIIRSQSSDTLQLLNLIRSPPRCTLSGYHAGYLEALPEVVEAVAGTAEVYLDGGIRRGTDVFQALALGARAVLIGRPVFWGLAVEGETGVRMVLEMRRDELDATMGMCGCTTQGTRRVCVWSELLGAVRGAHREGRRVLVVEEELQAPPDVFLGHQLHARLEAIHALDMRVEWTFAWEYKFKRSLLRVERIQQRHYGMKVMAYTLINLRAFCGI